MRTRLTTWLVAGAVLAAAGLGFALWISTAGPPAPASGDVLAEQTPVGGGSAPVDEATAAQLRTLREILLEEIEARERLEAEVEVLRAELTPAPERVERPGAPEPASRGGTPWFDEQKLLEAGIDAEQAAEMRGLFEGLEMDRLYLEDRAHREGWHGTSRFVRERRAIDERSRGLRTDLGEARYDWYLYAIGRPNRVAVRDVLESSPAGLAGLAAGDVIERYADTRAFDVADLQAATREGRAGELVALDVIRAGESVRIWLPRGPLGVRLRPLRREPTNPP